MPAVVRSIRHGLVLALVLSAAPIVSLAAQSAIVQGRVRDSAGGAISGALISAEGTTARTSSTAQGKYVLRGVPAGTRTIRIRAIGFAPLDQSVTVGSSDVLDQDFTMARSAVDLAPIDVVIGSRGRHTAAEELAVPVDVYTAEDIQQQGTTETSQILAALSPSINFPHQTVTDASDIVRPFTLRGLSPDHTLVLVNGWRRHQTALLNTFPVGSAAGSSGVDLNAIPGGAIDRVEVLRDGASAQYGSDAIAGVVNIVMKEGKFSPFLTVNGGRYYTGKGYKDDGTMVDANGGVGLKLGRGSLGLFGEYQHRDPTNRSWADPYLNGSGADSLFDDVNPKDGTIIQKNNSLTQPSHHYGDGLERDVMTFANLRMPLNESGSTEFYTFGGYSDRVGTGNGFFRYFNSARNWQELYPKGFLPEFRPTVRDYSGAGGIRTSAGGWAIDLGASYGRNTFDYDLRHTNNASLGPCLVTACAPGLDGVLGNADDPGIPNQTAFFAGRLDRGELISGLNLSKPVRLGLANPVNVAVGAAFRRESYKVVQGEFASWANGSHLAQDSAGGDGVWGTADDDSIPAPAGSSVFGGFRPGDASDHSRTNFGAYIDLESDLSAKVLLNLASRFETYSDFGQRVTGKAALRIQPSRRVVLRGAASTGFRAPGLAQSFFSHITTSSIGGQLIEVGNFPVDDPVAKLLGSKPLKEETSINFSGGLALSPSDNFTLTLDVFHIKINDRILLGATFDDDTTLAILANNGITNIGAVQYFTNGLDTKTQGIDLTADLKVPAGGSGTLDFTLNANYTKNSITRISPLPAVLANSLEPGLIDSVTYIGITEERPDWRGTLTTQYSVGGLHALARGSYYGKFSSAQLGFCDLCRERYGAKTLVDVELGYRFSLLNLSVGVRNLFDTYPDQPSSTVIVDGAGDTSKDFNNNFGTFPWAAASPFGYNGRFIYTRAEIVFGW
ncbi:MAG: TonB-dependent receptor [Gemmatimonadales bacterium]